MKSPDVNGLFTSTAATLKNTNQDQKQVILQVVRISQSFGAAVIKCLVIREQGKVDKQDFSAVSFHLCFKLH